jgi:hypothetical protein
MAPVANGSKAIIDVFARLACNKPPVIATEEKVLAEVMTAELAFPPTDLLPPFKCSDMQSGIKAIFWVCTEISEVVLPIISKWTGRQQ